MMLSGPMEDVPWSLGSVHSSLGPWEVYGRRGHILGSSCSCEQRSPCNYCRFTRQLGFPHMPDMVFSDNALSVSHRRGGRIDFTALDAMKDIDINREPIQVACAEEWQESRSGTEQKIKPFDWTFMTNYKGTFHDFELEETTEKINMELLKKRENILFYVDLPLYEDELHDHGIASCSVKMRVMPSCWFILLRFFLRVDHVMSRINDTRMFYQLNSPHVIVEHTVKESSLIQLNLPPHVYTDPIELSQHLQLVSQSLYKINLPR